MPRAPFTAMPSRLENLIDACSLGGRWRRGIGNEATRQLALQLAGSKDCAKVYNRRDWKSGGARRDLGTLSLATTNAQRNQGRIIDTTHPLPAATHRQRWQTLVYSAGAGFFSVSRDLLCLGRAARHHTHRHLFAVHRSGGPQGTSVAESDRK